jgi:integrase
VEAVFWKSASAIRNIFRNRSEQAGMRYYHPHQFRHAAVHLATEQARTTAQIKAISHNLGHENIGTTLLTYGKLDDFSVGEIIGRMNFKTGDQPEIDKMLGEVPKDKLIEEMRRRMED